MRDNQLQVSSPINYPKEKLEKFLYKSVPKFKNFLIKVENFYNFSERNPMLKLLGKEVPFDFKVENSRKKVYVKIGISNVFTRNWSEIENINVEVTLRSPKNVSEEIIIKNIKNKFYKSFFPFYKLELDEIARRYNVKIEKIEFKNLTGSWGLCSFKDRRIVLSRILCHMSPEIQRYVMVHEVAHLVHRDHSKNFWNLVKVQCPNYAVLRKSLKW